MNENKNAKNAKNEKSCKSAKNDNSGAKLPAGTPSSQNDGYTVNDTTDPAVPNRARTQMKKNG